MNITILNFIWSVVLPVGMALITTYKAYQSAKESLYKKIRKMEVEVDEKIDNLGLKDIDIFHKIQLLETKLENTTYSCERELKHEITLIKKDLQTLVHSNKEAFKYINHKINTLMRKLEDMATLSNVKFKRKGDFDKDTFNDENHDISGFF